MGVAGLLAEIRESLAARADPVFRAGQAAFFREAIHSYGVRSPDVKTIAGRVSKEVKTWTAAQRNQLANELWKSGRMEEGVVAIYVYRRFRKQCAGCEFRLFERWIDQYVGNWAHCDGVSSWLLAACIENEPALIPRLMEWTRSPNRWKRRAAAVSLLQEAKKGRHTADVLAVAGALLRDGDDMVRKGTGWLLKEAYPARPREVVSFLAPRKSLASRVLLRYAAEKMTPGGRAKVLGR